MARIESTESRRSDCPIACALDIIGDKWTLLVVRDLALGKRHFESFLDSPERIATNVLTDRLRRLEKLGFVSKDIDQNDRRKSFYLLTSRGQELRTLMRYLARWGLKNISDTELLDGAR